jgi:hypothetical protein
LASFNCPVTLGLSLAPCACEALGIAINPNERTTQQSTFLGFIVFPLF